MIICRRDGACGKLRAVKIGGAADEVTKAAKCDAFAPNIAASVRAWDAAAFMSLLSKLTGR